MGTGKSDVGRVRENNEDSVFFSNEQIGRLPNLYIVADGMGGHNAGEIASAKSVEFFLEYIRQCAKDSSAAELSIEQLLKNGASAANANVYALSLINAGQHGMGTTFTACTVEGDALYFAHVGDSRLYLVSRDEIKQITEDHTFVNEMVKSGELTPAEAQSHPRRNMLTRALGTEENTPIDTGRRMILYGDAVLLCSDGLTNMLSEAEIHGIAAGAFDNEEKAARLVEKANEHGGFDNVSVVII
ncbi:MAG: Stp1/IreP family PP2C-type Ser/Thr phosphatase [Clostridiales bacterium]|jgi:protein phosphatase|nr:Stp1/IreP family PP2C-type Ser/Thr phosphatase [Clostridiales bacterium]